jgi:hypothetical protein
MILDGLRGVLISSSGLLAYRRDIRRCGSEKKPLARSPPLIVQVQNMHVIIVQPAHTPHL